MSGCFEQKHPPEIMKSEEGKRIYTTWCYIHRLPHDEAFEDFTAFYEWSMQNGFTIDGRLYKVDRRQPFSPDNCVWDVSPANVCLIRQDEKQEYIQKWNRTVNVIREHYGMSPFPVRDLGG